MDAAMGVWATQGFGSKVELEPCDNPRGELCGTVIWLWDAFEEDGEKKTDQRNPAADKRSNPIVGTRILSGFRRVKNGEWAGGKIYNPDDGRLYSATIRVTDSGMLELKGCALRIFCQTQTWRRVVQVCSGAVLADDKDLDGRPVHLPIDSNTAE